MSVDPQVEALLARFRAARGKPVHEMSPREARLAGWAWKSLMGEPDPVPTVSYQYVPGPTADLPVRIYRPTDEDRAPVLIYFPGGGFVLGNLEICDAFCRRLANRSGCVVVAVDYQKAPEHKFPIPFDDCYAVTEWVAFWAEHLRIDKARIAVCGDSAGANLAAAVAIKARDADGPRIAWQLLAYPCVRYAWESPSAMEHAEGYTLERAGMEYFWNHYVRSAADGDDPLCAPLMADSHARLPPAFIVCAEYDPLLDDGRDYAGKLADAGVSTELKIVAGMPHGFLWMFGVVDRAREVLDEIAATARAALTVP